MSFVHLHVHSEYSLLDATCRLDQLIEQAVEYQMPALALTDHGVLCGAIEFYLRAREQDIQPILGCELYVAPKSRFERSQSEKYHHLTVLAKDETGYRNLMKLSSLGFLEGFYYRPRVDKELLRQHSEGLIALSGCLKAEIPTLLLKGDFQAAERSAKEFIEIFGEENFFVELQNHGLEDQVVLRPRLIELARRLGLRVVATNDVHFLTRPDHEAHEVFINIASSKSTERRSYGQECYLKSPQEMAQLFPDVPEALENTLKIAELCQLELDFSQRYLPHFELPSDEESPEAYLEKLAWEGLQRRYPKITPEIEERLRHELAVIQQMGFASYFLIVQDLIGFARSRQIPVGPGRGSAAGSLVCYTLGITDVDPLKYGLIFERFLNPDRIELPDIDIDFCMRRRDEVICYVQEKYGSQHVAQIVTFDTMAARSAVRDVARALGISYTEADKIAKLVPFGASLEQALAASRELREFSEKDEQTRRLLHVAQRLEGRARNAATHAAGVVIAPKEITEYAPLMRLSDGSVITQYDMISLGAIGMLKMDFLGLRTLTVLDDTLKALQQHTGQKLRLHDISLDDAKTYSMLQEGRTAGVFQLEGVGIREMLKRLEPTEFKDLIALLALYRPGPLESGMANDYIERKHGRQPISYPYPHPKLKEILEDTYGLPIYQDQVLMMARVMAGFSLAEADTLRKAIGKKNKALMEKMRQKFIEGCLTNQIPAKKAEALFADIEKFARYGFVKAHSTAYALISYWTAYLKANYPTYYLAALLTSVAGHATKVRGYIDECREFGIEVLPPDINESDADFTPIEGEAGRAIRFGLGAIKNVGRSSIEAILRAREAGPFLSFFDFCRRVEADKLNREVLESLIKAGCFAQMGTRKGLIEHIPLGLELASQASRERKSGQRSFFAESKAAPQAAGPVASSEEFSKWELLSFEKELLGLYVSGHPLEDVEDRLALYRSCTLSAVEQAGANRELQLSGRVESVKTINTQGGKRMAFVVLEDLTGQAEVTVFPAQFERFRPLLKRDRLLCIQGRLESRNGRRGVIAEEIVPFEELDRRSELHLLIPIARVTEEFLAMLREILRKQPGESRVFVHLNEGEVRETIEVSERFQVQLSRSLLEELERQLGSGRVKLQTRAVAARSVPAQEKGRKRS